MYRFSLVFAVAIGLASLGCRKKTPVEEVSVSTSGVALTDQDLSAVLAQWPQWRGPHGDGVASEQETPISWSDSENIRFRSPVPGRGHGSPIVVGESVVLSSADEQASQQMVIAYDRTTGDQIWKTVVHQGGLPSGREVHQKATNANSTLASDGTILVTTHLNSDRIFVTGLDLQGGQVWQRDIGAFASKFGYAPSPVLYKSFVIVAADNFGGGYLVALDRKTGEIAWRRKRGDASSYSSPMVATVGGVDQVLISGGDRLASYDPATGQPLWETQCIAESTCGTVIATADRLFASGGWPDKETVCLSGTGERIWTNRTKVYEPSLVTDGQHVFGVTDDGIAYCWSAEDGDELWRKRLGGNFSSSPVLCSGKVYVSDLSGNGYVFKASGEAFELISKNSLGGDCYASPAIVDGAIYFRVGIGKGPDRREELVCVAQDD